MKSLPKDFREQHPGIQWRRIAGMRDHLIHRYFGIEYDVVWAAVTLEVPVLARAIRRIVDELDRDG